MGLPCSTQAIHQISSVTSYCRPCSSATSRRHTLRWVLDLPSLPARDDNRNVSVTRFVKRGHLPRELLADDFTQRTVPWRRRARGCTGRVILPLLALPADGCQLQALLQKPGPLVRAVARLALLEELWAHCAACAALSSSVSEQPRRLAPELWPGQPTASSKSFFDSVVTMLYNWCAFFSFRGSSKRCGSSSEMSSMTSQINAVPNSRDMHDAQILIAFNWPLHKPLVAHGCVDILAEVCGRRRFFCKVAVRQIVPLRQRLHRA